MLILNALKYPLKSVSTYMGAFRNHLHKIKSCETFHIENTEGSCLCTTNLSCEKLKNEHQLY